MKYEFPADLAPGPDEEPAAGAGGEEAPAPERGGRGGRKAADEEEFELLSQYNKMRHKLGIRTKVSALKLFDYKGKAMAVPEAKADTTRLLQDRVSIDSLASTYSIII